MLFYYWQFIVVVICTVTINELVPVKNMHTDGLNRSQLLYFLQVNPPPRRRKDVLKYKQKILK